MRRHPLPLRGSVSRSWVGGGLALAVAGSSGEKADWGLVGTGGAVALAGLVFGAYFGFREDEARIEVVPLGPAEAPASTTPSSPNVSMRAREGATLRLRF